MNESLPSPPPTLQCVLKIKIHCRSVGGKPQIIRCSVAVPKLSGGNVQQLIANQILIQFTNVREGKWIQKEA